MIMRVRMYNLCFRQGDSVRNFQLFLFLFSTKRERRERAVGYRRSIDPLRLGQESITTVTLVIGGESNPLPWEQGNFVEKKISFLTARAKDPRPMERTSGDRSFAYTGFSFKHLHKFFDSSIVFQRVRERKKKEREKERKGREKNLGE